MSDLIVKLIKSGLKLAVLSKTDKEKFDNQIVGLGCLSLIIVIPALFFIVSLVIMVFSVAFSSIRDASATFTDYWIAFVTPLMFVIAILWTYFYNKNDKGYVTIGDYLKGIFIMWFFPFFASYWLIKKFLR
jgi:uncharacterized membrane protein